MIDKNAEIKETVYKQLSKVISGLKGFNKLF